MFPGCTIFFCRSFSACNFFCRSATLSFNFVFTNSRCSAVASCEGLGSRLLAAIPTGPKFAKGVGARVVVSPGIFFEGSGTVIAAERVVTLVLRAIAVAVTFDSAVTDVAAGTLTDGLGPVIDVATVTLDDEASGKLVTAAGKLELDAITNGPKITSVGGVLDVIPPGRLSAGFGSVIDVEGWSLVNPSGTVIRVEDD